MRFLYCVTMLQVYEDLLQRVPRGTRTGFAVGGSGWAVRSTRARGVPGYVNGLSQGHLLKNADTLRYWVTPTFISLLRGKSQAPPGGRVATGVAPGVGAACLAAHRFHGHDRCCSPDTRLRFQGQTRRLRQTPHKRLAREAAHGRLHPVAVGVDVTGARSTSGPAPTFTVNRDRLPGALPVTCAVGRGVTACPGAARGGRPSVSAGLVVASPFLSLLGGPRHTPAHQRRLPPRQAGGPCKAGATRQRRLPEARKTGRDPVR